MDRFESQVVEAGLVDLGGVAPNSDEEGARSAGDVPSGHQGAGLVERLSVLESGMALLEDSEEDEEDGASGLELGELRCEGEVAQIRRCHHHRFFPLGLGGLPLAAKTSRKSFSSRRWISRSTAAARSSSAMFIMTR